jgi:hypothetical protein
VSDALAAAARRSPRLPSARRGSRTGDSNSSKYLFGPFERRFGYRGISLFNSQLRNCVVHKIRLQLFYRCNRFFDVIAIRLQFPDYRSCVLFTCCGDVKDVARFYAGSSMMNFLGYDLGNGV